MIRRIVRFSALALAALAVVYLAVPASTARAADAVLRSLSPATANPGAVIAIEGTGVLQLAGPGSTSSAIRYGVAPDVVRGDLVSSGWSSTRVRARLPADITPGVYWLAVYRNGVLSSNRLPFTVGLPARAVTTIAVPAFSIASGLSAARVIDGPDCTGHSVIRLTGGPFRPGTDSAGGYGGYRLAAVLRNGQTGVEVSVADDSENRYWNSLIYQVHVANERELEIRIGRCFVIQKQPRIRAVQPGGARTNWVDVRR